MKREKKRKGGINNSEKNYGRGNVPIQAWITIELRDRVARASEATGLSRSEVITAALEAFAKSY